MRAQSGKVPVQGVRRGGHLPARSDKEQVQGVRRGEHLPAQSAKEHVQGVRRWGGICQHNRIRSKCKTCKADKDESMPPDLEEL